jgi:hypothetical protein
MGNVSKVFENGKLLASYSYDSVNRLIREDNVAFSKSYFFTYDNNGNIVGIPGFASIIKNKNSTLESCQSSVEKTCSVYMDSALTVNLLLHR